jgi:hypothetical protein
VATVIDPFAATPNPALLDMQAVLFLACGRSKTIFHRKRRGSLCSLLTIVNAEADNRGLPVVHHPPEA